MRRLVVIAALAGALVALLVWRLHGSDSTPPPAPTTSDAAKFASPVASPPSVDTSSQADDQAAQAEPDQPLDPERDQQVQSIHMRLIQAAVPCYRNRAHRPPPTEPGAPDETMQELRVAYTVVIAHGTASIENVERADPADPSTTMGTPLQDEDLGDCIVAAIGKVTWTTDDGDDSVNVVDTISVGDLDRTAVK